MSLLVLVEHDRGSMAEAGREALTHARLLSDSLGQPVEAVIIGDGAQSLGAEAASFGADVVHIASHDLLVDYGPDAWGKVLATVVAPGDTVLSVGSDRGNEVLAVLAARLGSAFVANAVSVEVGDSWKLTRLRWGGSLLEDVTLAGDTKIVSMAHHSVVAGQAAAPGAGTIQPIAVEITDADCVTMVRDRVVLTQGVTLATSPVVIGGGRGVGSAEAFAPLEELAELLGGVVGCSRAVTNNGWRNHSDQVGQTGTRIAPDIYIASGISGAIQHWVGAMASKKILAINTDPEANMVTKADYAVIGDLHEVIPAVSAEIKRRRG